MFAPNADEYSISGINARARCAAVSRQNEQLAGLFAADGTFLSIDGLLVWRSTAAATVAATWSRHGATGELSLDESAHITLHAPRPVSDVELCGQPVPHSYDGHSGAVEFEASAGHSAWEIRWGESNDIVTVPS
jgi:hypothetical protein